MVCRPHTSFQILSRRVNGVLADAEALLRGIVGVVDRCLERRLLYALADTVRRRRPAQRLVPAMPVIPVSPGRKRVRNAVRLGIDRRPGSGGCSASACAGPGSGPQPHSARGAPAPCGSSPAKAPRHAGAAARGAACGFACAAPARPPPRSAAATCAGSAARCRSDDIPHQRPATHHKPGSSSADAARLHPFGPNTQRDGIRELYTRDDQEAWRARKLDSVSTKAEEKPNQAAHQAVAALNEERTAAHSCNDSPKTA